MLGDVAPHTTIPASDLERAKRFYSETLGLEVARETPGGFWVRSGGREFLVFPSGGAGSSRSTVMGFAVDDIEREVADLRERGVTFEEYDTPNLKTENGIATTGPIRAAWFRDSEANIIGVVEIPDDLRA